MQCVNCQFHNMPGASACGRCGSPLGLAAVAVDVHPPRAGGLAKRLRRLTLPRQAYYAARDAARAQQIDFQPFTDEMPPGPVLARLIVPGWGQLRVGQRWQGWLFFWSFVAVLLPGLLWFGSSRGSVLLGLAFSIHSAAAVDIFNQAFTDRSFRAQLTRSIVTSLLLAALLYWPASWLLTRVAAPFTVGYAAGRLAAGDIVMGSQWAEPLPGRVVMFDIPDGLLPNRRLEGHTYVAFTGQCIDRVLAGPGDRVERRRGVLLVNDRPCEVSPLAPGFTTPDLECTVPQHTYFIVPSTTPQQFVTLDAPTVAGACLVPRERIHAVVYAVTSPLSHARLIR